MNVLSIVVLILLYLYISTRRKLKQAESSSEHYFGALQRVRSEIDKYSESKTVRMLYRRLNNDLRCFRSQGTEPNYGRIMADDDFKTRLQLTEKIGGRYIVHSGWDFFKLTDYLKENDFSEIRIISRQDRLNCVTPDFLLTDSHGNLTLLTNTQITPLRAPRDREFKDLIDMFLRPLAGRVKVIHTRILKENESDEESLYALIASAVLPLEGLDVNQVLLIDKNADTCAAGVSHG